MFKKVLKLTLLFVLGILSLFAVSCAGTAGGGIDLEDTALSVMLPNTNNKSLWDVSDVQVFTVTISSKSYKDTKTAPGGNTITFSNIPVGHYNIEAIGKNNNGDLTAKGSAEVDVMENVNSAVTVKLSRLDYYTVEFDLEGGTGNISEQKVTTGYTAKIPANPTYSDPLYHFVGWTLELKDVISDCVLYDFSTPVNGDITLHAIWSSVAYTDFTGTVSEFLIASFESGSTATSPYNIVITDATSSDIDSINTRLATLKDSGNEVFVNLDLSRSTGLTEIPSDGFYECSSLIGITFPNTLEKISHYAFNITGLTGTITIPASCTYIGYQGFDSSGITSISFENGTGWKKYKDYDDGGLLTSFSSAPTLAQINATSIGLTYIQRE